MLGLKKDRRVQGSLKIQISDKFGLKLTLNLSPDGF